MSFLSVNSYGGRLGSSTLSSLSGSSKSQIGENGSNSKNFSSLKITRNQNASPVGDSPDSNKLQLTGTDAVENKTSNILSSSTSDLNSRKSYTESTINGINKLKVISEEIQNEVNPERKQSLIEEADSILSTLKSQYSDAIEKNPNLAQDSISTALVKPGADYREGQKFTEVLSTAILSPSQAGLDSVDFSDPETATDQLDASLANYGIKSASYESSSSEINGATKKAISQYEASSKSKTSDKKEVNVQEVITSNSKNLIAGQNNIDAETVTKLLDSSQLEDQLKSKDQQSESLPAIGSQSTDNTLLYTKVAGINNILDSSPTYSATA